MPGRAWVWRPGPAGSRTGKRGRLRVKGVRLSRLAELARTASFAPVTVARNGSTVTVHAAVIQCLWHGVLGARAVQVVLVRDRAKDGYNLALASTDLATSPAAVIERHAGRPSIEVAIEDARQIFGAGKGQQPASGRRAPHPAVHPGLPPWIRMLPR